MNNLTENEKYWVWLSSIDGVFAKWFYLLQGVYIEPEEVFRHADDIVKVLPKFPQQIADAVRRGCRQDYLDGLLGSIEKKGLSVTTAVSADYPYSLRILSDPPPVLYYKGTLPSVWERSVSIVGTRRPTRSGVKFVRRVASEIAGQEVIVVSGMARGIDTAAHMGTLDEDGTTIAVLGCGADIVYPKENRELYERIIQKGAVLSEFRPETPPIAENFPRRNRIIAAISQATVVSEGGVKSGARITADIALSLGKQVFAIPVDPGSYVSALPLSLLKSGAAVLSESADLMDVMNWAPQKENKKRKNNTAHGLDFFQEQIYNSLLKGELTAEQIADRMDIPVSSVNSALTMMEILGAVERLPGNLYCIK